MRMLCQGLYGYIYILLVLLVVLLFVGFVQYLGNSSSSSNNSSSNSSSSVCVRSGAIAQLSSCVFVIVFHSVITTCIIIICIFMFIFMSKTYSLFGFYINNCY